MARLLFFVLVASSALGLACAGSDAVVEDVPFTIGHGVALPILVKGGEARMLWFDPATGDVTDLSIEMPFILPSRISPDGAMIYYRNEFVLRTISDGKEQRLPRLEIGGVLADWSSDGERLLFAADGLKELRIEDDRVRVLYDGAVQDAAWSPDGSKVAFIEDQLLTVLSLETGEIKVIAPELTAMYVPNSFGEGYVSWSPDGTQLAFADWSFEEPISQGRSDIYIVDADGENLRRVTDSPRAKTYFTWSPDGSYLAFIHSLSDGGHLRVVDVGAGRLLDFDVQTSSTPHWVGQDELLVSDSGGITLERIDGPAQPLLTIPETSRVDLIGWAGGLLLFAVMSGGTH